MNTGFKVFLLGACFIASNAGTWIISGALNQYEPMVKQIENPDEVSSAHLAVDCSNENHSTDLVQALTASNVQQESAKVLPEAMDELPAPNPITHPPADVPENNLPEDVSFWVADEHAFNKESFDYDSSEQKVLTIESLSAHGEDLEFIQSVVFSEELPEVKIAAINKLGGQTSYVAVNTVVTALADESPAVAATALAVLVASGDKSLLPPLKQKASGMVDGPVKAQVAHAIQEMEYTKGFSLDMDY